MTSDWSILGDDRIRRWPSKNKKDKRALIVEITSWIGTSPGAKHYYLKIDEEKNQWWSSSKNDWVEIYNDTSANGYHLHADMMSEDECIKLAKSYIDLVCGKKRLNHRIVCTDLGALLDAEKSSKRITKLQTPGRKK